MLAGASASALMAWLRCGGMVCERGCECTCVLVAKDAAKYDDNGGLKLQNNPNGPCHGETENGEVFREKKSEKRSRRRERNMTWPDRLDTI